MRCKSTSTYSRSLAQVVGPTGAEPSRQLTAARPCLSASGSMPNFPSCRTKSKPPQRHDKCTTVALWLAEANQPRSLTFASASRKSMCRDTRGATTRYLDQGRHRCTVTMPVSRSRCLKQSSTGLQSRYYHVLDVRSRSLRCARVTIRTCSEAVQDVPVACGVCTEQMQRGTMSTDRPVGNGSGVGVVQRVGDNKMQCVLRPRCSKKKKGKQSKKSNIAHNNARSVVKLPTQSFHHFLSLTNLLAD